MTVFLTGAFGLLLVVTTSADTSHGDTIAASTASNFGVPLLFWSFSWSFCKNILNKNKAREEDTGLVVGSREKNLTERQDQ